MFYVYFTACSTSALAPTASSPTCAPQRPRPRHLLALARSGKSQNQARRAPASASEPWPTGAREIAQATLLHPNCTLVRPRPDLARAGYLDTTEGSNNNNVAVASPR